MKLFPLLATGLTITGGLATLTPQAEAMGRVEPQSAVCRYVQRGTPALPFLCHVYDDGSVIAIKKEDGKVFGWRNQGGDRYLAEGTSVIWNVTYNSNGGGLWHNGKGVTWTF